MHLHDLRGRRVAVWGTGREGIAAVEAIAPHRPDRLIAIQDKVTHLATSWTGHLAEAAPLHEGDDAHRQLAEIDVIVRSPSIPQVHPWIIEHRVRGGVVTGGTALWMADHASKTVGVTGSKGKSTTSTLVHHLLQAAGRPNTLGGNIGIAALSLPEVQQYVVELSVYQCADLTDSPKVVALTSLFPEHLDWAGSEAAYYRDKLNLARHGAEVVIYNAADERLTAELGAGLPLVAANVAEGYHEAEGWFWRGAERLFPRETLGLLGRHNAGNLCVALAAVEGAGVDVPALRAELATAVAAYRPLDQRLTQIADPSGLTFVDDTLSTIPQSAIYAIEAFAGRPLTVLLGGEDRGVDYGPLRDFFVASGIRCTLIGIPDSGERILSTLQDLPGVTTVVAEDLPEAVRLSRKVTPPGGVVLLSPAAPSYGRYDNWQHKSRVFREAIEASA
ncbi:UDP-N-acetylmuramoyl-L-alanine--D-glutamate ligase [Paractinoplanes rishiriensis]|uniref:UDP-N-acetylmuramoylalanine--D-glutamate ligase n=1 Tax=Paractinoplanes rishiriensis TaxID=1050105 RepID=A0A919K5D4_9ACTN|nr:UDP-N-acetylmuramoyl-L-alanine--D-glutamate ligase [Actinoplanes rishiriensis]GIE99617.1 UDP-N-acetylmuramoylalanine--D-glutamate ligase [Actinoplanes rishiriensis]